MQIRPCLWRKKDPKFNINYAKNAAIEEIARLARITPADIVKEKLRSLRNIFSEIQRKKARRGGGHHQPRWEYYNALLYMEEDEAETVS